MPPFGVVNIDFRPWRRQEDLFVVAAGRAPSLDGISSLRVLQRRRCIDETAVEKGPTPLPTRGGEIGDRHVHRAPRKGCKVHPRQGRAFARQFFRDDPAAGFLHYGEAA